MIKDKIIVVTGGAGIIGKEFIKAIVKNRGIAIIADIDEDTSINVLNTLSQELDTKNIDFIKLDITSKDSLKNCINYLNKKYRRIDALVNNAYPRNKNYGKYFEDVEYTDFVENLGLNLGGYFITSQQFSQYFKIQGHGNIINISSIYGVVAPKFEIYKDTNMTTPVEYAAIKAGLIHLTKYMAKYFRRMNIRVNTISPGGILNNQPKTFLDRYKKECLNKGMLDSCDITGTLLYLLSDFSKYVNGQNIIVDDGFSI